MFLRRKILIQILEVKIKKERKTGWASPNSLRRRERKPEGIRNQERTFFGEKKLPNKTKFRQYLKFLEKKKV
jgi:hypothetical protein